METIGQGQCANPVRSEKTCSKCGHTKPLDAFYKHPYGDGRRPDCKTCKNTHDWNKTKSDPAKRERANKNSRDWAVRNKDRCKAQYHARMETEPERIREQARINYAKRGGIPEHTKVKQRKSRRKRVKERLKTDPVFAFYRGRRADIYRALRGTEKAATTLVLLGCSIGELRSYLQSLWLPGMSWENYGVYKREGPATWHVDHIVPCASFDLLDPEQQKRCFHWTNLRPLWALDNMTKGDTPPDTTTSLAVQKRYEAAIAGTLSPNPIPNPHNG